MQEQKWDPFVCQLCSIENFLEHVRQKMCDPFICQLYFIKIFRTKKCDKKMWPYCLRILLIKVRHKKSVTLLIEEDRHCQARHVHVDRLNFNNYTLTGILLKKVQHKKCDPFVCGIQVWYTGQTKAPQLDINRNYAQKSATWKVWPLVWGKGQINAEFSIWCEGLSL